MSNQVPSWMQDEQPAPQPETPPPEPSIEAERPTPTRSKDRLELLNRIHPVEEDSGPFKGLIYGPKGVGKTVFCCRARNCILIAAEPGQKSLNNHPDLRRTPVLPVKSFNDLDEIAWAKLDGDLDSWAWDKFKVGPIITFIIDTTSELANKTASELLDKAYAADQRRNRFMISQAEYRVRNELFRRLTADYVNLGVNFIMTAHETESKDEETGRLYLRPDLSDTMANSIGGLVDLQGRLTLDEGEKEGMYVRRLQVHPTRRVDAKTRIGGLPLFIDNPDINDIMDASQRAVEQMSKGAAI